MPAYLPQEPGWLVPTFRILLMGLVAGGGFYFALRQQQRIYHQHLQQLAEQEAARKALTDHLQFLQTLIDSIPAPIFYKNAEGIYTGCNRAFEAFLGKPREEIVGRSVYGVSPGPQASVYHEKDLELMRERGHQVYESSVVYADGSLHDVIFHKGAYELEDGRLGGLIGVILDISERKALERELVQAKERAEFFSRSKTQFLTNMSHEIRTPLNAIVGFSEVLRNRSREMQLPADFHEFLHKIDISGQRLAELVNDVLDISRIEAGKIEASEEDFHLRRLLECILVSCEVLASRHNITFDWKLDPELPAFIRTDRGKLSQVLINLIGNAIKFSPSNSSIDIRLERLSDREFTIEIADKGIGIPPEQQAIIFEPFEQVDKSTDGQSRGTGLGLPITRSLVQLLGGEIYLVSQENVGTRFRVSLPLREGKAVTPGTTELSMSSGLLQGKRAVIFEDNPLNQALMQAFCDDLELDAVFVSDGRTGIERVLEIQPDLIFMDVQLPGLNGLEATEQIRKHPAISNIPIIGLSAAAFSEQRAAALQAGMNDYLSKPVSLPQLAAAIDRQLREPVAVLDANDES
ncbi:hybrid sensor histidine kinase/response regulator [Microbulbifer flavimaris]|uniref:histidine kinase n=1 Tax=Microbulbifer flavimaris TaxID=1781068 RepID=A0ABX4HZZ7_9GAMM|nr:MULTISPECIES: ATP-binding protein [Microbulbifer]KUJ83547.1 hypothetical protein AVO43_06730 [Microbulbifer sp. ZGT114]PCO05707.1 hybrid sensor histidine kinase/response regulator [Microbulbifer flavimaris]